MLLPLDFVGQYPTNGVQIPGKKRAGQPRYSAVNCSAPGTARECEQGWGGRGCARWPDGSARLAREALIPAPLAPAWTLLDSTDSLGHAMTLGKTAGSARAFPEDLWELVADCTPDSRLAKPTPTLAPHSLMELAYRLPRSTPSCINSGLFF